MKVTVKLFATLQKNRFEEREFALEEATEVKAVLEALGISKEEATIIFINGIHADWHSVLHDGDVLSVFPPIGGG